MKAGKEFYIGTDVFRPEAFMYLTDERFTYRRLFWNIWIKEGKK